jgi:hypothetical protein
MARYIDAELAKAEFTGNFRDEYSTPLIKAMIDDVPTADVEEVRHGKWLFIIGNGKEEIWMCDQCERSIVSVRMEKDELIKRYPYCHCGAKMRGENDG